MRTQAFRPVPIQTNARLLIDRSEARVRFGQRAGDGVCALSRAGEVADERYGREDNADERSTSVAAGHLFLAVYASNLGRGSVVNQRRQPSENRCSPRAGEGSSVDWPTEDG